MKPVAPRTPKKTDPKKQLSFPKGLLTEGKEQFFAPVKIPRQRRLQTFVIVLWLLALPICAIGLFTSLAVLYWIGTSYEHIGPIVVAFLVGLYSVLLILHRPQRRAGVKFQKLLNTPFYRWLSNHMCQFFPSRVVFDGLGDGSGSANVDRVKQEFFNPSKKYLVCWHPHGLFGLSLWTAFIANPSAVEGGHRAIHALCYAKNAPMRVVGHTMRVNFYIPWWREWLLLLGFCDVERETLLHCLSPERPGGHISCLVPGGAAESVNCTEPILKLKDRKGFIKIALQTGCSLVPVYAFGETKLYKPFTRNRKTLRLLRKVQKLIGVGTPLVCGRGIFNYGFGFLPHREPIVSVIGKPIAVPRMPQFTKEDVDRVHEQYVAAVKDLYRRHQPLYDPTGPEELELI